MAAFRASERESARAARPRSWPASGLQAGRTRKSISLMFPAGLRLSHLLVRATPPRRRSIRHRTRTAARRRVEPPSRVLSSNQRRHPSRPTPPDRPPGRPRFGGLRSVGRIRFREVPSCHRPRLRAARPRLRRIRPRSQPPAPYGPRACFARSASISAWCFMSDVTMSPRAWNDVKSSVVIVEPVGDVEHRTREQLAQCATAAVLR